MSLYTETIFGRLGIAMNLEKELLNYIVGMLEHMLSNI